MRILIFNPDERGHNFVFLKFLVPALNALDCNVTIALTEEGFRSEEYRTHLAPISGRFHVDAAVAPANRRRDRVAELAAAVKRSSAEHLMVPNAEPLLALLGAYSIFRHSAMPPGVHCDFTLIRSDFAYPSSGLKQQAWFWMKERSISALSDATISLIDPVAFERINARGSCLAGRIRLLPEPLDNVAPIGKADARQRLGLPERGRILGCTGRLDRRKGVDTLVRAFALSELTGIDRLLLAGEIDPEITEMLHGELNTLARSGRIILRNQYLSDEDLNYVICASDVVAATYLTSHLAPSGIVNKSAVIGRPVLASRFGWSDFMVPEFGLGALTDINDMATFAQDIALAMEQSGSFVQSPKTARLREFLSPENFAASWTANIAQRLGRPKPDLKTWEWVRGGTAA